jgi:hypothetical protein
MAVRGPLVTAVVVMGGLIGMMTVNSVGGLVVASDATEQPPAASDVAATSTETESAPQTTEETTPAQTTEPQTTEAPPEEPPAEQPPPAPALPAEAVWAGEVAGGPMTIAVAVKGDEGAAYICDGADVESWLQGSAVDGRLDLKSKNGANRVVASMKGKNLTGTVVVAGKEFPFTAAVAKAPAGVYRGEGANATIGWIVMADGTQVGIATSAGRSEPAPKLDPSKGVVTLDGERITANKVAGDIDF